MVYVNLPMFFCLSILSLTLCSIKVLCSVQTSSWTRQGDLTNKEIVSQHGLVLAKSKLHCLVQCRKYWNCVTIAYVSSTGQCYFNPMFNIDSVVSVSKFVIKDKAPVCREIEAPTVSNAVTFSSSPRQDLTTFELDVDLTCIQDFLHVSSGRFPVRCLATGVWETDVVCKQRIWRDGSIILDADYYIPDEISVGWSACFSGTPTDGNMFTMNIFDKKGDTVVHFNPRFTTYSYEATILDQYIDGVWILGTYASNFYVAVGQSFSLTIKVSGATDIDITMDGNNFTYKPAYSVLGANRLSVHQAVSMSYMDLWCP